MATTEPRELVLAVIAAHTGSLLALARRHSICADDAHDAYQRALEIFLRRADSVDPVTAAAWLRTVVKHEAMAVRAARLRVVGPVEVDLDRTEARELAPAEERAAAAERDARSAEALARLKPQEVRALVLKARGYSYREICEITGWTYTKVNRCLTEGRRAFLDRFADIEAGRECERWAGTLSALADGEASAGDLAGARPHLRHCAACRARLREFRAAPRAVAALTPAGAVLAGGDSGDAPGLLARVHEAVVAGWHDRVLLSAHKFQAGVEAASAAKVAAVAASATALAGGGAAALTEVSDRPPTRPAAAVAAPRAAVAPFRPAPVAGSVAPDPAEHPSPPAQHEEVVKPSPEQPDAEFDVAASSETDAVAAELNGGAKSSTPAAPSPAGGSSTQPEFGP
jgi:RNA polymerase sigma factor (sigma-70 family)